MNAKSAKVKNGSYEKMRGVYLNLQINNQFLWLFIIGSTIILINSNKIRREICIASNFLWQLIQCNI